VVGTAVRPIRIPPTVEHDEGVQIDSAATTGMSKVTHSVNLISDSCWSATVTFYLMLARSMARTRQQCTSLTCPATTGLPAWMRGNLALREM
jgi:hypothetical protein